MKFLNRVIIIVVSILAISCSAIKQLGKEEVSIAITSNNNFTLSNCKELLEVVINNPDINYDDIKYKWTINGKVLNEYDSSYYHFFREVDEDTIFIISVELISPDYFGFATTELLVKDVPFSNPLTSSYNFSEEPVIEYTDNTYVDAGSVVVKDDLFYCFYNSANDGDIINGVFVSKDGKLWEDELELQDSIYSVESLIEQTGSISQNIHVKSVVYDGNTWNAYITAARTDFFYGDIYLAQSAEIDGEWIYSDQPILKSSDNWESTGIGISEVIKISDDEYYLFYTTGSGKGSYATSNDGISWVKNSEQLFEGQYPSFLKFDWGWLMLAQEQIFLSIDGAQWFRYKDDLYSYSDLSDRDCTVVWVSDAIIYNNKIMYYIELGNAVTGSDIYLIEWEM